MGDFKWNLSFVHRRNHATEPAWQALYDIAASPKKACSPPSKPRPPAIRPPLAHHQKTGRLARMRLKTASNSGVDIARRRQLLVSDRFLERTMAVPGNTALLKGGLVLELRLERDRRIGLRQATPRTGIGRWSISS